MESIAEEMSIGEVANVTGLSVHALRFFEREGLLLRDIPRGGTRHRVYAPADVEWLKLCNRFRASGMPLATIRTFADLVRAGPGNEAERLAVLQNHEQQMRDRIASLYTDLQVIHEKAIAYERHVQDGTTDGVWDPTQPPAVKA
ncbi:MerR family transcriptional regulator [Rhodococcus sp. H29-C3]|uniref:MerR family transcriptional regulator n=1 Tax=Rhodococcus sp. H29-C3 TaxID=3046307 RepID=UPI0024B94421|nr:MerR family transcriptional regulator [Rhodococcus sp. H29-C3]MDJ0363114.1 MerR family transcriptional regulator [Rhodococcus sp. H29-C3]